MAGVLDLMGYVQQQGQLGEAKGKQNRLASLSQQAYTTAPEQRTSLLADMARTSPEAAQAQHKQFRQIDTDAAADLAREAGQFVALAEMGDPATVGSAYAKLAQRAQGVLGHPLPPTYDAKYLPGIQKLASATGGADSASLREFNAMTAGMTPEDREKARRVALGLDGRASSSGYTQVKFTDGQGRERVGSFNGRTGSIDLPDGTSFNPQTGQTTQTQAAPPQFTAPPQGPTGGASTVLGGAYNNATGAPAPQGGDPFASLTASVPGLQVTSRQRSPEHNAKVGGVPNSYHLTGQATDILPPNAQQAVAVRQWAASNGMEVIDEGDHWHMEPRGHSQRQPQGGDPFTSRPAEEQAARTTAAQEQAKINAEIDNYRTLTGLSAERTAAEATAKGAAEAQVANQFGTEETRKAAREANAKLPQLKNAVRGVDRIGSALKALDMPYINTGPLDQYAVRKTKAGQELETAVGAIQNSFLALTRVPGVGSQSDLEQRVAMLQYPSLDKDPEVNARTYANLQAFARDLEAAYANVTQGGSGGAGGSGAVVQRATNPQTGEVLELRNGQWVPAR